MSLHFGAIEGLSRLLGVDLGSKKAAKVVGEAAKELEASGQLGAYSDSDLASKLDSMGYEPATIEIMLAAGRALGNRGH